MWGFFSNIYPLLFIWEGAERYVDKLIHSDQENLGPPQRSAVLFTVYAFNTLVLLHGQATGKLRACNTQCSQNIRLRNMGNWSVFEKKNSRVPCSFFLLWFQVKCHLLIINSPFTLSPQSWCVSFNDLLTATEMIYCGYCLAVTVHIPVCQ